MVLNDTEVKNADIGTLTMNQLTDERTRLITVTDAFEAKVDKLTADETTQYGDAVDRLEAVMNAWARTPQGIKLRKQQMLLRANQVVNLGGGLMFDGSGPITTRPRWEDDKEKYGFATQRDYLSAVVNMYKFKGNPDNTDPRMQRLVMDAVGTDEFSKANWESAGVMVPRGFLDGVMQIDAETDVLSSKMTRVPMTTPIIDIIARVDKDHRSSVTGGFRVYRGKETAAPTLSKSEFEVVSLKAHEINGAAAVTNQLMADSPTSIAALIDNGLRTEQKSFRMNELINGNGIGRPLGMLHSTNPALITVLRQAVGTQPATQILNGMNVLMMRQRCWGYETGGYWLASLDLYVWIATLCIESPNNAGVVKIFTPGDGAGKPDMILGRPVIWTEYMNGITVGQDGSTISEWNDNFFACVNPSQMLFGERGTGTITRSIHVRFLEREEVFLFTSFDDARPWWKSTLQPVKAGLTLSPFVVLSKTAAT
jgi:HK97 family phage major capsid protein